MQKLPTTLWLLPFLILSCHPAKTPSEKVARQFMDRYYVDADLQEALEDCEGLALEKIKNSLRIMNGQTIDSATHHPKITYSLLESKREGGEVSYLYRVVISPEKVAPMEQKTLLKVRERGKENWKVTQFSDHPMEVP